MKKMSIGRREREAGKRHRRARVSFYNGAEWITLKLGRKKSGVHARKSFSSLKVADTEMPGPDAGYEIPPLIQGHPE